MSAEVVVREVEEGGLPVLALRACCVAYLKTAIPRRSKFPPTVDGGWAYVCIKCFQRVPFDAYVAMVKEVRGERQGDPS